MDAHRLSDGRRVFLKRVPRNSPEIPISRFFTQDGIVNDPRNHCVTIVDYFEDESLSDYGFLVTPIMRDFDSPEFLSIDEVLEFVRQTLEVRYIISVLCSSSLSEYSTKGLVYMHEKKCCTSVGLEYQCCPSTLE